MKEQIIQIPDTLEIKEIKDGKIILVEKKVTYEDVARELFPIGNIHYFIDGAGIIEANNNVKGFVEKSNNTTSKKQAQKLLAINKLINVTKYLNDGWQPDWDNSDEYKHYIIVSNNGNVWVHHDITFNSAIVYFKSQELAEKAIEILGEETIKLAFCIDY